MVFAYYSRLTRAQQRIYRASDAIEAVPVPDVEPLRALMPGLAAALQAEDRAATERACAHLAGGLCQRLKVPPVAVSVLAARPHDNWGELHGLYEPLDGRRSRITVWMRTARRRQVVAFKSFLRTVLHELGHHLDYELFRLPESFHTEGFYKRESSLFHQLVPDAGGRRTASR